MSGIYSFMPTLPYGLNLFQYMALFAVLFCVLLDKDVLARLWLILPYAALIVLYYSIGLIASDHISALLKIAIRNIVGLLTLIISVPITVMDEKSWHRVVKSIQIAAIITLLACIAEASFPKFTEFIARRGLEGASLSSEEVIYYAFRPSGLLRNANETANFFVLSFILSHWCSGFLKNAGRIASVIGTYLTASRGGAILLVLSIILYIVSQILYSKPLLSKINQNIEFNNVKSVS